MLAVDGLPERARVLELGSGAGPNAEILLRRFPQWHLVATEYDKDMVELLRRRLVPVEDRMRVEQADATAITMDGDPYP